MGKELPKTLWMLWFQGWENAPLLVKKCRETWIEHNPDWTIHFLSNENLSDFIDLDSIIPGYKEKNMPPEALSNIVRLSLLVKYGGVWADSTLYCNQPLSEWLPEKASHSGFFAFANPGPDRMLSNWFIAGAAQNVVVEKWWRVCVDYWEGRTERHTYFWCHYLFGDLYQTDPIIKEAWDKTPKLSADDPHYFLPYDVTFYRKLKSKDKNIIDQPVTPLFKLSHRVDMQKVADNSVLRYLLSDKKTPQKNGNWLTRIFK